MKWPKSACILNDLFSAYTIMRVMADLLALQDNAKGPILQMFTSIK